LHADISLFGFFFRNNPSFDSNCCSSFEVITAYHSDSNVALLSVLN
jgi:hypothetical protein